MSVSPLKVALGALWLAALVVMWDHRHEVVDAYATDREPVRFQLQALSLETRTEAPTPSPYTIATAPETGAVALPFLAADQTLNTRPPVALSGGSSRLRGTVRLNGEPVADATIRITRITSTGSAEVDLRSRSDGSWERDGFPGGRYRVRAFVSGELGSASTAVFFLPHNANRDLDLLVSQPTADTILGLAGPEEIGVGLEATVGLTVGIRTVDGAGRIVVDPLPGATVAVTLGPPSELLSANVALTDGQGAAAFLVRCGAPGTASVTVDVNGQLGVLTLPPCVAAAVPDSEPVEGG